MKIIAYCILILTFIPCCNTSGNFSSKKISKNSSFLALTKNRPTSKTLAESANQLIKMGETKAVAYLVEKAHVTKNYNHIFASEISWMCKLIFQSKNKEPLRMPLYGALSLPYETMPLNDWPLFPLAISDGVIFVLDDGYSLSGLAEQPLSYLNYCIKNGSFRTNFYKIPTITESEFALNSLIKSKIWLNIKWSHSEPNNTYTISEEWTIDRIRSQIK